MKKIISIGLSVNLLLLSLGLYFYNPKSEDLSKEISSDVAKKDPKRIAIVTPTTHPSLEQIEKGFVDQMKLSNKYDYRFVTYNANGNRSLLKSQIEEAVQKKFDLIFTLASGPSLMAKEIVAKKNKNIPIVFAAVNKPKKINLVGDNVTGSEEIVDYKKQLSLLLFLKPDVKKVLLVYTPTSQGLQEDKDEIENILKTKGIELKTVEIYQANETYSKTISAFSGSDVIMVLKDNTVVSALDGLVNICNKNGITLLASDLDSVERGASVCFGVKEYDYGVYASRCAKLILEENKKPSDVPVVGVDEFKLIINKNSCEKQGVSIKDDLSFLIGSGSFI